MDRQIEIRATKPCLSSQTAVGKFEEFRENSRFCDVSLKSGHALVKAHRAVLAAASPYFKGMFNANFKEGNEEFVTLAGIHPDVLPLVINYIYTGRVMIQSSTAQDLMIAAQMLGLDGLVTGCTRYIVTQLDECNALPILSFAEVYSCSQLTEYTWSYIGDHWTTITQEKEFMELPLETLIKILSSDKFAMGDELEVVRSVVRWLEHEPCARAPHCSEVVRHLRLDRVPMTVLEDVWSNVKEAGLAENFRAAVEMMVPVADTEECDYSAFYVVENPLEDGSNNVGSVLKYHLSKEFWEIVVPMTTRRFFPGVAALGGRLYVVGGENDDIPLASGEVYDPNTNEWSPIATMNEARSQFGLVALKGKLYVFGGRGVNVDLSSIEVYDPEADRWTRAGDLRRPMCNASAVSYDGYIYLSHISALLRYDPTARPRGAWETYVTPDFDHPAPATAVLDGYLYVMDGVHRPDQQPVGIPERFAFEEGRWLSLEDVGMECSNVVVGAAKGVLLMAGDNKLNLYDPQHDRWSRGPNMLSVYDPHSARWTPRPGPPESYEPVGSAVL